MANAIDDKPADDESAAGANAPTPKTDALLGHADVVAATRRVLIARGYPLHDIEEGIAEVRKRVWEQVARDPARPTTIGGWIGLSVTFATTTAIDELRRAYTRSEAHADGDPDAHPAPGPSGEQRDPVDAKRQIEMLRQHLDEEGPEAAELLDRVAAGEKQSDIARDMKQPSHRVRKRLGRLRAGFVLKLTAAGIFVAGLFWLIVFYLPGRDQEAHKNKLQPQPQPQEQPAPSALPPSVPVDTTQPPVASGQSQAPASPQEQAAKIRAQAIELCQKSDWDGCNSLLDMAFRLDPHEDAKTKALHDEAYQKVLEQIRELEAKPGLKRK